VYFMLGDAVAAFVTSTAVMSLQPLVSQLPYERS